MSAVENTEGEFMPLQKDESKVQDSPNVDTSAVHQEGIEHIKGNIEALSQQQAPASNPGSNDPSGGIAAGSGGASSEPTLLDYSGEGAQKEVETSNKGTTSVDQEAQGTTSGSDAPLSSAAAGAAVAATSEQASSDPVNVERSEGTTIPDSADAGTGSTGREINMADSDVKGDSQDHNEQTHQEEAHHEAGTAGDAGEETKEKAAGDQKAAGEERDDVEEAKPSSDDSKKGPVGRVLENKSAIPTAGGVRLGEKHWGESKIVPDVPKKTDEEGTGQTDQQTADNTAKNAGGSGASSGEAKESMGDKIKHTLHMG